MNDHYLNTKSLRYKNKEFASVEDYFQFMIDELGFPPILQFFERTYTKSGSYNLHLWVHEHNKDAPTVLFLPGTSVYAACYGEIMYEIGKKGYNVIGLDPRGHGLSEGPRGDYTITELMDDVKAVIRYAKKRFNKNISLMGSSQGGIVCFYLAAENIKVDSIICQNIANLTASDVHRLSRYQNLARIGKPLVSFAGKLFPKTKVPVGSYLDLAKIKVKYFGNLKEFIHHDPFTISKITLRAAHSLTTTSMACSPADVQIPTYVFQGVDDSVFPVDYTRDLFETLTCKKELKLYPGCDHAIMVENVDMVTPDILAWLEGIYS